MEQTAPKNPWFPEPYVQKIIFADGSVVNGSAAVSSDGNELWAWPAEHLDFMIIMEMFGNSDKTSEIKVDYAPYQTRTFVGYTKLTAIQESPNGKLSIRLNKP